MKFESVIWIIHLLVASARSQKTPSSLVAHVSNAIADSYSVTCMILLMPDQVSTDETQETQQVLKMLFESGKNLRPIVVQNFSGYANHVPYRYNIHRCPKLLHIIYGQENKIQRQLQELSFSVVMGGPVWVLFLSNNTSPEEYLKHTNIPFDANFIVAIITNTQATLTQLYRVSMLHTLKAAPLGKWTPDNGLMISSKYHTVKERTDFEGHPFRVSAIESWPMSTFVNNSPFLVIGGYCGAVWKALEERLNFTTVLTWPKENAVGAWNGKNWTGLIGMISRNEIDVAVSGLTITPERLNVVDFFRPLVITRYQLFFKQTGLTIQWDVILRPFQNDVWLTVLFWLCVVTLILVGGHYIGLRHGIEDPQYKLEYISYRCVFVVLSAFMQQGNSITPKSVSCRLTLFVAYMFSLIIIIIYSGTLMSMIAVQKESRPFNSLESFLKDGTYTLEQIPGSDGYTYFSNSTEPVLKEIYQKLFSKLPDKELPDSYSAALRRVCERKRIAHLGTHDVTMVVAKEIKEKTGCPIIYLETPLRPVYLTIATAKDNPFKIALDYQLSQMANSGILRRFQYANFPLTGGLKRISSFNPVRADQIVQVHIVYLTGAVLSVLILYAESMVKKYQTNQQKKLG